MQTNPAVEQSKIIKGPRVPRISLVEKKKVCRGKDLPKAKFQVQNERLNEKEQSQSPDLA